MILPQRLYMSKDITFIAHDYDGVNLSIIETAIRYGLPELLSICNNILDKQVD